MTPVVPGCGPVQKTGPLFFALAGSVVINIVGLFAGDAVGNFVAFDAERGLPLWHAGLHAAITNGPITYRLDGIQYVVVAANDTLYAFASPPR